jgi:hypothetical protein
MFYINKKLQICFTIMAIAWIGIILPRVGSSAGGKSQIIDQRPLAQIQAQPRTDQNLYTETEGFLSVPKMRELIEKNLKVTPYLDIISSMICKEAELEATHYVFYHGTDNVWRVPHDLFTMLYAYFKPDKSVPNDFKFMRFTQTDAGTPQEFLANEIKNNGLVNDNGEAKLKILSVNFTPFSNVGLPGECTWNYFLAPKSHEEPNEFIYNLIMQEFGLGSTYVKALMDLTKIYQTKEQTILQIFVPKNKIDSITYLSWIKGIPAHEASIDWVKNNLKGKNVREGAAGVIEELSEQYKAEKDQNPLFQNLLQELEQTNFSVESYLKLLCNKPAELEGSLNDLTARLLFTPEVLLNPASGAKFYRYSTAKRENIKIYYRKLTALFEKIVNDKKPMPAADTTQKQAVPYIQNQAGVKNEQAK